MEGANANQSMSWLIYALMTVCAWGVYGNLLHTGQVNMADPVNGRYKAFLFVGVAYFFAAILPPVVVLLVNKASWNLPWTGISWSLIATPRSCAFIGLEPGTYWLGWRKWTYRAPWARASRSIWRELCSQRSIR